MKKILVFMVISLFLISFISAGMTASAIDNENKSNNSENGNQVQTNTENEGDDSEIQTRTRLTAEQVGEIIRNQNRIRVGEEECPERCTCNGSATRCMLEDGTREMTVVAGNSGNVIIQTRGIDASTNVELYRSENRVYGKFGNGTREVKVFPDQVQEKIRERIRARLENQTIELDEDGVYQVQVQKRARLFFLFPVRERVNAEIDSETGEVIRVRNPWWGFLAKDEAEEESE